MINTPRRIVAYLDGLYPGGHLRQAKVNALRDWWSSRTSVFLVHIETQSAPGEELSPPFTCTVLRTLAPGASAGECHFGDATQSALLPSILAKAFKGEL